jgi:hypothetical protein
VAGFALERRVINDRLMTPPVAKPPRQMTRRQRYARRVGVSRLLNALGKLLEACDMCRDVDAVARLFITQQQDDESELPLCSACLHAAIDELELEGYRFRVQDLA